MYSTLLKIGISTLLITLGAAAAAAHPLAQENEASVGISALEQQAIFARGLDIQFRVGADPRHQEARRKRVEQILDRLRAQSGN